MYPPDDSPEDSATELLVTAAHHGSIGSPGEIDLYRFAVDSSGVHTMQTMGATDVFMTLFGPDSTTTKIAEDDDSGQGRNSQIVADLDAGTYFLQVRHFSDTRTGDYGVSVTR